MSTYNPAGWVILKFIPEEEKCFYKIFGTWRGSFLNGDSWRLSSGSTEFPTLSECGLFWIWPQYSGSTYELPINEEDGYTFYTGGVLENIIAKSSESGILIERVQLDSLI